MLGYFQNIIIIIFANLLENGCCGSSGVGSLGRGVRLIETAM